MSDYYGQRYRSANWYAQLDEAGQQRLNALFERALAVWWS